ncbi:MAG: hypothetical protein FWC87_14910 [Acidimicrobiaceae bacterium]|nr:hypothetical protein [Acidimicrobiaceae bacterium]
MTIPAGGAAGGPRPTAAVSAAQPDWVADVPRSISGPAWERLRRALPTGVGPVAIGLLVSGAASYVFLAVTARLLGPLRYAPLASFWALTFLIGPGFLAIIERETGRQLSSGAALGVRDGPVVRRTGMLGGLLVLGLIVLTAATAPLSASRLFDGNEWLVVAFALSLPALWAQHLSWGTLAGNGKFRAYGRISAAEGMIRLAGCGAIVLVGAATATPYGFVVALTPLAAALFVAPAVLSSNRMGPLISLRETSASLSWLLVSSLLSSVLVNSGPIAVSLLATGADRAETGRFLTGLVLVRVPLFLYNSASATLLPALSAHAAAQEWRAFRSTLVHLSEVATAVGLLGVLAAATIGPEVLRLAFGARFVLPHFDLALLAGSAAALLLATTLSVAMMATGTLVQLAAAWGAGVLGLVAVIAAVGPLLRRVELGLLFGSLASAVIMAGCLSAFLRTRFRAADAAQPIRSRPLQIPEA